MSDRHYPGSLGASCLDMNNAMINPRKTLGRIDLVVETVTGAASLIVIFSGRH